MTFETIYIASDHGGLDYKQSIMSYLAQNYPDISVHDCGPNTTESVDYPDYAHKLANAMKADSDAGGILICGTGIGISIAANRHAHIRAALCHDVTTTRLTREHNDANVLAMGQRIIGEQVALDCVKCFLESEFEGGRHTRRVEKINIDE